MNIQFYTKDIYGRQYCYIVNKDHREAIQQLTGSRTLLPHHKTALIKLGFTFERVLEPEQTNN